MYVPSINLTMPSYVIYCRKSSESEERQVLSIESQIKELNDLTKRLGLSISEVLTESRSAKSPGRPVFGRLMEKVSRGEIKGIVSWKLDRLARNPLDGAAIVWALDQGKIQEIITPSNHLRNNSNDKFLMQLEFGMAKKYVDDLSDNVRRGLRMKLEKGWLPGKAPLGYLNEPTERTIVPDPERFPSIRRMWELLLQGVSPLQIHRIATEELGLRQRRRGKGVSEPINLSTVYKILVNPFYFGMIHTKGIVYQGKHQAMVTENEFWRAQELLGHKGRTCPKTHSFTYTGLIRCGECGCSITAENKTNRYGSHYVYYHCSKRKPGVRCNQKVIRVEELEKQLAEFLARIHVPKALLRIALEHLDKEQAGDREREISYRLSLEKAHSDCERKLGNLNQMRIKELIDDAEYTTEKGKILDEKHRLGRSLQQCNGRANELHSLVTRAFILAHEAKERFKTGSPDEKKALLREIGSNFSLTDKNLTIEAKKPFVLIQNALNAFHRDYATLEPSNDVDIDREFVSSPSNFRFMWALVHEVRTFYERNDAVSSRDKSSIAT
ncbi:MAG: recombinase family protein [Anaerolineales bacterium]